MGSFRRDNRLLLTVCVVSCNRYELTALFPFFIFPVVMISLAGLPLLFILKKITLICPFVLAVGIFNPVFDRQILLQVGSLGISGGWISFASILARSLLTVGAALILVATTGFTAVCQALERLGMPQVFAVQLLFLYRYIFVLTEESGRAARARDVRSCGKKGQGIGRQGRWADQGDFQQCPLTGRVLSGKTLLHAELFRLRKHPHKKTLTKLLVRVNPINQKTKLEPQRR